MMEESDQERVREKERGSGNNPNHIELNHK